MTSYSTRNNAFTPARQWVLDGATRRVLADGQPPPDIPLREVRLVRLEFFSQCYEGLFRFRETPAEYARFVDALHRALAQENPACRFLAGASPVRFWAAAILLGTTMLVFAAAMLFLHHIGFHMPSVLRIVLILVFLPVAILWFRRNRPRAYQPDAIPPEVLPRQAPADDRARR